MRYFKWIAPLILIAATVDRAISQRPPAPPSDPPPNGTQPGGGLDPATRSACTSESNRMRALIPVKNPVLTTTNQPTIFFYIPFGSDQIQSGEFSLLAYPKEQQRLHTVRFTLPKTPGIVSVTLPSQPEIEPGKYYHWYFQLYCRNGSGRQPDLTLHGFIQRTGLTPERQRQINAATSDIWYDAIAQVAGQLQTSPQNPQLRTQWRTLLQTIDAEHLAQEPLLGSVIVLKDKTEHAKPVTK
ncbi:DUF928 domain-containing protein [Leptolyngbya sp. NIES-2104]|uniref:DUF928 domain-containing protein n=1 Tax=Leptolyngbya sp. NIES-2104 TaxID=1552121 RepID=UPI0006ECA206|nr:DUF928 domain-containing protein [Leptolyngbya sp. NIES-2104]GAP94210.1 membrane protein related to metalloendopeptidase [Leptolyngbya sp. NIES-2104]